MPRRNLAFLGIGGMSLALYFAVGCCSRQAPRYAFSPNDFALPAFLTASRWYEVSWLFLQKFLEGRGPAYAASVRERIEGVSSAVVQIQVDADRQKDGNTTRSRTAHGSGVVMRGRYVFTAGHVAMALSEYPDRAISFENVRGKRFPARVVACEYVEGKSGADWAVLEAIDRFGDLDSTILHAPGVSIGAGSEVLVLGYPDGLSMASDRMVVGKHWGQAKKPIPLLGRVSRCEGGAYFIEGLAGGAPLGGMSGCPIIDLKTGAVVAVLNATIQSETLFEIMSCPVSSFAFFPAE